MVLLLLNMRCGTFDNNGQKVIVVIEMTMMECEMKCHHDVFKCTVKKKM